MRNVWDLVRRQPPAPPPYVLEGYSEKFDGRAGTRRLFSAFGFEWRGTPTWWIQPLWILGAGLIAGAALERSAGWDRKLLTGVICAIVIAASMVWHQVGTFVVATLLKAPFQSVVVTPTLDYQIYDEQSQSSRVHLLRALAGPASNLLLGVLFLLVMAVRPRSSLLWFAAILNLVFTVAALMPIPTMDGGVIWRELRGRRPGSG